MDHDDEAKRASRLADHAQKEKNLLTSASPIDIKQFQPSAKELIAMTPSEKQAVIDELNSLTKKAEAQER